MASYNKVLLMGNLTRDVEIKQIAGGQSVANIGLAVNRAFKTQSGEDRDETTFIDCEAWGRQAEVMAQYLSKGRPVFIEGRLKLDTWQDKSDGSNRSKMRVVVEGFQFIDSGGSSVSGAGHGKANAKQGHGRPAPDNYNEPISADDIPF